MGVKEKGERSQFDHLQCSFSFSDKDNGIGTRLSNSLPDISQKCRNGTTPAKKTHPCTITIHSLSLPERKPKFSVRDIASHHILR
jgi:hypothetical protein